MDAVTSHNISVLSKLEIGDTVEFKRGVYSHYGVYVGFGEVVHLAGTNDGNLFAKAIVKMEKFLMVAGQSLAFKANKLDFTIPPLPPCTIVGKALSRLGNRGYNILTSNCEHFANWCRYGTEKSGQANGLSAGIGLGAAAFAVGAGVAAGVAVAKNFNKKKQPGYSYQ